MAALSVGIIFLGYLLGSIPFGYLVGRSNGIDIRAHGSHNIGATNVLRVMGKPWGLAVFSLDAVKGFAAVRTAIFLANSNPASANFVDYFAILAAATCVAGHSFPIWLRFKGGKGVATSAGAIFGIMPVAAVSMFLVWLLIFRVTRYVSLASVIAASTLPFIVAILLWLRLSHGIVLLYVSTAMTALVVWRHRSNLSRLMKGTEQRFTRK
jgi:acyl phosphate:glycerol-3-phosphate acyltransferase